LAVCPYCDGRRIVECSDCKDGYEIGRYQNQRVCPYCGGIKTHWSQGNFCDPCQGTGVYADKVPCRVCNGTLRHACRQCNGTGTF
jgi:hypothetical protein